jgi:hypothetical protein
MFYQKLILKVVLDQLIWTPFWSATYMGLNAYFKGEEDSEVLDKIKTYGNPRYLPSLAVWIPANIVTYGLIEENFRVIWADLIEVVWCIILASKSNSTQH